MQRHDSIYVAYADWLHGRADEATAAEVERQLAAADSELLRLIDLVAAETRRLDDESGGLAACLGRSFDEIFPAKAAAASPPSTSDTPPPRPATISLRTPAPNGRPDPLDPATPSSQVTAPALQPTEPPGPYRRRLRGRVRNHPVIAASVALLLIAALGGSAYGVVVTVAKSRRSDEVVRLVQEAKGQLKEKNRDEALRLFGQAQSIVENSVSGEAADAVKDLERELNSVKKEMALVQSVGNLLRDSNRLWLDENGIRKASADYQAFFGEAGLPLTDATAAATADSIRSKEFAGPYLVAALDHWLSVLYLTPGLETNKQRLDLIRTLQQVALRADVNEKSKKVRGLLAVEDLPGFQRYLDDGFGREVGRELHPETVGQLSGFLLSRGDRGRAFEVANSAWWVHPDSPTLNNVVAHCYRLGYSPGGPDLREAARHYSACVSLDRLNPVYWYNLALVYKQLGNIPASDHAHGLALKYSERSAFAPPRTLP